MFGAAVVERGVGGSLGPIPRPLNFASASSTGNGQVAPRHVKQRLCFEMLLLRERL